MARSCGVKSSLRLVLEARPRYRRGPRPARGRTRRAAARTGPRLLAGRSGAFRSASPHRPTHPPDRARVGVGDPEPRQNARLQRLHTLGLRVRLMIVADADAESRAPRDGENGRRAACCSSAASRSTVSKAMHDVAEQSAPRRSGRRRPRERTGRWSALSMPRQRALSARTAASSARLDADLARRRASVTPLPRRRRGSLRAIVAPRELVAPRQRRATRREASAISMSKPSSAPRSALRLACAAS